MRQSGFVALNGYQTWQALALTIFCPALQPKALAKSALFCTEPLVLYWPGECESVLANRRELSGFLIDTKDGDGGGVLIRGEQEFAARIDGEIARSLASGRLMSRRRQLASD